MVVLDAMGVVYTTGDDVADLLIPFVRKRGCQLSDTHITDIYRQCSLGTYPSSVLWQLLGLKEACNELDACYLQQHVLTPGLHTFLQTLGSWDLRIACLSNDVAEWSSALRQKHTLEDMIDPWIISGEVGVRKPDPAIYEHLLKTTHVPPQACVFFDDRLSNLDAASSLGFRTVWFRPCLCTSKSSVHPICTSFQEATTLLSEMIRR